MALISGFVIFTFLYIIGQLLKDASIIDIFWGLTFIAVSSILFLWFNNEIINSGFLAIPFYIMYGLIWYWGLRISIRIFIRNKGKGEDFRYKNWRNSWGKNYYWKMYLKNYMTQFFFNFVLLTPLYFLIFSTTSDLIIISDSFNYFVLIGAFISFIAITWEGVADYQLDRFIKTNKEKGKVLDTGLWKISRHPNYFGQQLIWYGFAFMAIALMPSWAFFALISPFFITLLFFTLSTPILENAMSKNPNWLEYAKVTPRTIPFIGSKKIVLKHHLNNSNND